MNYITIDNLSVSYDGNNKKEAVKDLSFSVSHSHIFGFLGPNGAGKTTTIKTMLGLIPNYTGKVLLMGSPPTNLKTKQKIGFMPEIANYYWYLTPYELLSMYAKIFRLDKKESKKKIDELLQLTDLTDSSNKLMKTFSKGMMQKVNFAQALINSPDLLILDEPTSGLDPVSRIKMRNVLKQLRNSGKTIFFSSHELSEAEMICDEVAIIRNGKLLKSGKLNELIKDKNVNITLEQYFLNIINN